MSMKIGVNDPCWCGSGLKFKKCHQGRESQTPMHPKALDNLYRKEFQFEICLHPQASKTNCGKIIKAHTIQRKGAIAKIVDSTNHLYTFYPAERDTDGLLKLKKVGWNNASIFKGFCDIHDTSLFADLETKPFIGDEKQCFLVGYRAMCHEMYQKIAVNASNPLLKKTLDVGKSKEDQFYIQDTLTTFARGTDAGFKDIEKVKKEYDASLLKDNFSDMNYVVISFDGDISFVSTGAVITDFDINGNKLQNVADLNKDMEGLMFGIISNNTGGAFVFSWLSKYKICNKFIDSLLALPKDEIPSVLIEFVFGYVENTYFSINWWDSLDKTKQKRIRKLASMPIMNCQFIKFSKEIYTNWKITNIDKLIR